MALTICLVSFVVAEKEGSHTGGVSIRGILSGLGLRTKDVFPNSQETYLGGPMVGVPLVGVDVENETKLST